MAPNIPTSFMDGPIFHFVRVNNGQICHILCVNYRCGKLRKINRPRDQEKRQVGVNVFTIVNPTMACFVELSLKRRFSAEKPRVSVSKIKPVLELQMLV